MLHGAYTSQEALKAGVLDGIEIQLRPFLLGQAVACSTVYRPSTSNSNWSASSKRPAPFICATTCSTDLGAYTGRGQLPHAGSRIWSIGSSC